MSGCDPCNIFSFAFRAIFPFLFSMRSTASIMFLFLSLLYAQDSTVVIFLSDTQTPIWAEKLFLESDNNEMATRQIFSAILAEGNIDAVIHAGDITGHGWLRSSWKPILPFIDSLRSRSVPFIAAKGNHDYYFIPPWGMELFKKFIPNGATDYSRHLFGELCIIILNSNIDRLSFDELREQRQWYAKTVTALENDPDIRTIITVAHHSPYTNSTMVSGSAALQTDYLPVFFSSSKSRLWVGGHAHRFEHFRVRERDFLVIGGGGGLFHDKKKEDAMNDLHPDDGRFFHYVHCDVSGTSLTLEIMRIDPDSSAGRPVYRVHLPFGSE